MHSKSIYSTVRLLIICNYSSCYRISQSDEAIQLHKSLLERIEQREAMEALIQEVVEEENSKTQYELNA